MKIGNVTIKETSSEKLLGAHIKNDLKWDKHIIELEKKLNYRLYCLRRLSRILPEEELKSVADGIFISLIRYAMPVYYPVRMNDNAPHYGCISKIETAFNNCLRLLNQCKLEDKISIKRLLQNLNWLSLNQLSAHTRLVEAWKTANLEDYCLQNTLHKAKKGHYATRRNDNVLFDQGIVDLYGSASFVNQTAKLWNMAPDNIKKAKNIDQAKREIRNFVKINIPL